MSKFHERAEAQTKQMIAQMLGDELLVQEGKKQQEEAGARRVADVARPGRQLRGYP